MSALDTVNAALRRGDFPQAAALAAKAVEGGDRHPELLNVAAFGHSEAGRYEEALDLLHEALELAPNDPHILYSIGYCLLRLRRDEGALAAFDSALAILPGFAAPLHHKGVVLERRGEDEQAERCYRLAMASDPNFEDPYGGLASIAAGRGEFDKARNYAQQALAISPQQLTAHLAIARADFNDGAFENVLARLRPILDGGRLDPFERPAFMGLLGDALDGLNRTEAAFEAWTEAKRLARDHYAGTEVAQAAREQVERLEALRPFAESVAPLPPPIPDNAIRPGRPRRHVFLVGFPRSGTTLLEQVLASHPDVVTLEEKPLLQPAEAEYLVSPESFRRLLDAADAELDPLRETYWRQVGEHGVAVGGKVFIDKLPLASLLIPIIARLFPNAVILFAERDPRDVVQSCFRRTFKMNAAMYQFVTLDGAARYYDRVMGIAAAYRRLVPGRVHAVRYEALVDDFEGQSRSICDFIGVSWTDSLRDFAATARSRTIRTPSAPQVRKGLYRSAVGAWRRYSRQMAPVLPILAPWVAELGYEASADQTAEVAP